MLYFDVFYRNLLNQCLKDIRAGLAPINREMDIVCEARELALMLGEMKKASVS